MALFEIPVAQNDSYLKQLEAFAGETFAKLKSFVGHDIRVNTVKFFYGTNEEFFSQFKRRRFLLTRINWDDSGNLAILASVDIAIALAGYMWSLNSDAVKAKIRAREIDNELMDIYKEVSGQMFNVVNQHASAKGNLLRFVTEDLPVNGKKNELVEDGSYAMMLMDVIVGEQEPAPLYFLFSDDVLAQLFDGKLVFEGSGNSASASEATGLGAMTAAQGMLTDYPVIDINQTIGDAYELMERRGVESLPISDDDGRIIRIVTKNNIEIMKSVFFNMPGVEERAARVMCLPLTVVNKNQELVSARPEDSLGHVARLMATNGVHSVPIIEEDGQFVGMVTSLKILDLIAPKIPVKKASKTVGRRRTASAQEPATATA